MLTTVEAFDSAALAALTAAATVLGADLKVGLFTNNPVISKQNVLGDVVEPVYTGYARQAVVLGSPFRDPNNGIAALGGPNTWAGTALLPVTINGVFYLFGAGPALLGIELFKTPQTLLDALSSFQTILEYIQSNQNSGFTTVVS